MTASKQDPPGPDAKLDEHIRRVVDAAPPLTEEQRARLRTLLAPRDDRR